MSSIRSFIKSDNPLSRDIAVYLSTYAEEDALVDYKLTMDLKSDLSWLQLTKDVLAFANTSGGYLFYGADDDKKTVVGISKAVANALKDSNDIQQKINRNIEPHITGLRSKIFRINGKTVAVLFVPQSSGKTHLISKDGKFKYPSRKERVVLHKGTFYVRRSGGNHLGDSRDLDDVIERRIEQFREALLDRVTKVVRMPASSEVFILSKDPEDEKGEKFIIEDSPESIPIKGMSFTVAPEEPAEEIAAWTVLSNGRSEGCPPPSILWKWYADRDSITISQGHKLALFQFSLWSDAPPFYWIRGLKNALIRASLLDSIRLDPSSRHLGQMLRVASFLGKSSYRAALSALGHSINKVSPSKRNYPPEGPRLAYGTIKPILKQSMFSLKKEQAKKLNEIVIAAAKARKAPSLTKRWKAFDIDCFLYAQDDRYK